ncbi:helix-turn-helix domain-containing protein [Shimwellia blattae]|uniref:Putative transcriptional repressor of cell division inhibition protein n=1 Tax=Shimwellia blattae (strain ATCC 29907 / DSM 4481 / JCM 1650 / NBRC 105725 / CDC 9005-74) TaxID=630626 RepID=I2B9H3_SHIBC|nr:helix-turn-helix domain-containing protein [Shimwellia blattae]AFJ47177.1 putative transcriptional repressor of cell division inhibition protein [Shimwellia blattae DSM 4481 = NBRC 105725]GAB82290.1 prophage Qin transcriptional regulator DicA [Shimwellia blattae DSM 4481 = NBRC 105725]
MSNLSIGQRVLQRRKEIGFNQRELGKAVGVSHSTVSLWESDTTAPKGKNLHTLSRILQCSPTWILFGDEDKSPSEPVPAEASECLSPDETELLELFRSLPASEQQAQLSELRARSENFEKLFSELLEARKRTGRK